MNRLLRGLAVLDVLPKRQRVRDTPDENAGWRLDDPSLETCSQRSAGIWWSLHLVKERPPRETAPHRVIRSDTGLR